MNDSPIVPIAFAHRGARAHAPENTIGAFELALKLGATGLESDVWLTADHQVALNHDGAVRKGTFKRRQKIRTLTADQLPLSVPRLVDLFQTCGTDYQLSLDIKEAAAFDAVAEIVLAADVTLPQRTWICSDSVSLLTQWHEVHPQFQMVHSSRLHKLKGGPEKHAADLAAAGIAVMNMHYSDWNMGLVVLFHRFGIKCFGWDAQQEREISLLCAMDIDGIYSDYVDRLDSVITLHQH